MYRTLITALFAISLTAPAAAATCDVDWEIKSYSTENVLDLYLDNGCRLYITAVGSRIHVFHAESTWLSGNDACEDATIEPLPGATRFLSFAQSDVDRIRLAGSSESDAVRVTGLDIGLTGSSNGGNDHLMTDAHSSVYAGDGNDCMAGYGGGRFRGEAGDDRIFGFGSQGFKLWGGEGDDFLDGGSGHDELYGEWGDDTLVGWSGDDLLVGGTGDDDLYGGNGNDTLRDSGGYENNLYGGSGDDDLFADGLASLYGQRGNDVLEHVPHPWYPGAGEVAGGNDTDTCIFEPQIKNSSCEIKNP